jgi:hypothetical protein
MSKSMIHIAVVMVTVAFAVIMTERQQMPVLGWAIAGGIQAISAQFVYVPKEKRSAARMALALLVGLVGCGIFGYAAHSMI